MPIAPSDRHVALHLFAVIPSSGIQSCRAWWLLYHSCHAWWLLYQSCHAWWLLYHSPFDSDPLEQDPVVGLPTERLHASRAVDSSRGVGHWGDLANVSEGGLQSELCGLGLGFGLGLGREEGCEAGTEVHCELTEG